ncbi:MAG: hypothetical protein GEU71_16860 [Actinobacteria bacterium]|nr:hypothetical protein [Actinomycetota bacterium]
MNSELLGFNYRFEEGTGTRTLLMLHGTGADENDLIPLGRALDPDAPLLSPRGKVLENGMPRFFRRHAEGVLDVDDLKARTHELVEFIDAAAKEHDLDRSQIVSVGFSNGANIAASTLLLRPDALQAAILLHPMVPFEPDGPVDLAGMRVFIGTGRNDPLIEPASTERLAEILKTSGAEVTIEWSHAGHQLTQGEIAAAAAWLG